MTITKEGRRFLLASFLIAFAALNTGNNLIYLILSLLLSFVFLSVILMKINLSGISLAISASPPVYAGEDAPAIVTLHNSKNFLPSYSVHVMARGGSPGTFFPLIPANSTERKEMRLRFAKRGLYQYGDFSIQSGFPFILFNAVKTVKVSGEVLVYPPLRNIGRLLPGFGVSDVGEMATKVASGEDIHSLRDFRYGDDWRKIHWKASAKSSTLLIREFSAYEFVKTTIIMDNLTTAIQSPISDVNTEDMNEKNFSDEAFEKVVSLTGSLARFFLNEGHLVRVISCKKVVPFGSGTEHLFTILDILALVREELTCESPYVSTSEGLLIAVLKSRGTLTNPATESCDISIYADTL